MADRVPARLPALREELSILDGGPFWTGAPSWLIHDPLNNRFYRIGKHTLDLLSAGPDTVATKAEISQLEEFLHTNRLTVDPPQGGHRFHEQQLQASRHGVLATIAHRYLFFRVPLFRPQKMLDFLWPSVGWMFTPGFALALVLLGLVSLYLVSRQWDSFAATFVSFLSFDGFLLYALSLIIVKMLHELGHAFMSRKYGVEVPIIGVAFLVMMPVLYTDTSGASRLTSRFRRLMVDCAGIFTELAVAVAATLLWVFLPDGPWRSIAFTTATVSWLLSLAINLNPFMRFDGYYILSDALGVENLQGRGFALARWRLREFLFGLRNPPPEVLEPNLSRFLVLHGWGTWIYRFFLFLGIAILVYHFFIKVIGVILFAIEIVWFIGMPIWRELRAWWKERSGIVRSRRSLVTGGIAASFVLMMVLPWHTRIDVPAVLKAGKEWQLFPPSPANVGEVAIMPSKKVSAGQVLLQLHSPDLEFETTITRQRIALLETRLASAAGNAEERSLVLVSRRELEAERQRLAGLLSRKALLQLTAPFDGTLSNVDPDLQKGDWVNPGQRLAVLYADPAAILRGLVSSASRDRLETGMTGMFIPDDPLVDAFPVRITGLADVAATSLDDRLLSETEGSRVPVRPGDAGKLTPVGSWFAVVMQPEPGHAVPEIGRKLRGVAVLDGHAESFAARIGRRVATVLVRESGF